MPMDTAGSADLTGKRVCRFGRNFPQSRQVGTREGNSPAPKRETRPKPGMAGRSTQHNIIFYLVSPGLASRLK